MSQSIEQEIADLGLTEDVAAEMKAFEDGGGIAGLVATMLTADFSWGPGFFSRSKCYWGKGFLVHVKPSCRCEPRRR